jgi:hypothetical protein
VETPGQDLPRTTHARRGTSDLSTISQKVSREDRPQKSGNPGLAIRIERPDAETTSQGIHTLTGRVSDGVAKGIYLYVNGQQQLLDVWGTIFEGEIALRCHSIS